MLIRGECISACAYLKDKNVKVDLAYIDPPFASGADYAKKVCLRKNPKIAEAIAKAEEELDLEELRAFEEKMYGDIWNKEDYLNWMYENLTAIKNVMSETASIYAHLDWHIGHYIKILMDEIFGEDNFINEIIWNCGRMGAAHKSYPTAHNTIFFYVKNNEKWFWESPRMPYSESLIKILKKDENGYYYKRGRTGRKMADWEIEQGVGLKTYILEFSNFMALILLILTAMLMFVQ